LASKCLWRVRPLSPLADKTEWPSWAPAQRSLAGLPPPDPGGRYRRTGPAPDGWASGALQGSLLTPEVGVGRWPTASHIGNAILREDARGARLAKEHKDSPRRIDAAVAAVMAHDRAAALAGVTRDRIYI
jgi:hypothetical protein